MCQYVSIAFNYFQCFPMCFNGYQFVNFSVNQLMNYSINRITNSFTERLSAPRDLLSACSIPMLPPVSRDLPPPILDSSIPMLPLMSREPPSSHRWGSQEAKQFVVLLMFEHLALTCLLLGLYWVILMHAARYLIS